MLLKKVARRALRSAGYEVVPSGPGPDRLRPAAKNRTVVHFLHIGKNAGTQIAKVSRQINERCPKFYLIKHEHDVALRDLPADAAYFFSIRNPVTRFVSGFYSRKRKGQPRLYKEWSLDEALAFSEFEHAVDLAEALFEPGERGLQAFCAIKSMRHTAQAQVDWFYMQGHFLKLRPPIWIIRQEKFDTDLAAFLARLGIESELSITDDPKLAHKTDYRAVPSLTDKAIGNLKRWYAQDFEFYRACENWIEDQLQVESTT